VKNQKSSSSETFGEITETWNPITGCLHNCVYCWAKDYAKRLALMGVEPYKTHVFKPAFAEWRLKRKFGKGSFIFVSDMGDMWGEWVPKVWIDKVLDAIRSKPGTKFLFLTKNPKRYRDFQEKFTENMMLGATIETNRDYKLTEAPTPRERYEEMKSLRWKHKALVIEPILDFDLEFISWIKEISPRRIYVGYDNYDNKLPEPIMDKTKRLINELYEIKDVRAKAIRKAWYEKESHEL